MSDRNGTDQRVVHGYVSGRKGRVIALKPGDPVPEGAIPINRSVVADIKYHSMKNKPLSQT